MAELFGGDPVNLRNVVFRGERAITEKPESQRHGVDQAANASRNQHHRITERGGFAKSDDILPSRRRFQFEHSIFNHSVRISDGCDADESKRKVGCDRKSHLDINSYFEGVNAWN